MEREDEVISDIKDLPTLDELGNVDQNIIQVNCQRSIAGSEFISGSQDFLFNVSGNQKWSPARSYFRLRCSLRKDAGIVQPLASDRLAFAENFVANLYSNIYCYIGNVDISSVTQFCGQAGMIRNRLSKTKPWLDSIGKSSYYLVPSLEERINSLSSDALPDGTFTRTNRTTLGFDALNQVAIVAATGVLTFTANVGADPPNTNVAFRAGDVIALSGSYYTVTVVNANKTMTVSPKPSANIVAATLDFDRIRFKVPTSNKNEIEILFQPPVGLFNTSAVLPSGSYRISMMPHSNLIGAVQSDAAKVYGTDYNINIESLHFFMSVFRSETSFDSGTYYLGLDEWNIQQKAIVGGAAQNSLNFTLPASTVGIATFAQSTVSGADTRVPPGVFTNLANDTLDLRHLQITYANTSKPNTDWDSEYQTTKNHLISRYHETYTNCDLVKYSCETFDDWVNRGGLYYFNWVRSADDRSTECQLTCSFGTLADATRMFVASAYRNVIKVNVSSGFITSVQKLSV